MTKQEQPNVLEMVAQLDILQRRLTPLLPKISEKLISDLIASGTKPQRLAKVIGRSPGYVKSIAGGGKSLSPAQIMAVVTHAAESAKNDTGK